MKNENNIKIAIERINYVKKHKLHYLDLVGLQLRALPVDISDMHYLLAIDISYNFLTEFPTALAKLENIQTINISNNWLQDIAFEEGRYYLLNELDISDNNLNFIPDSLDFVAHADIIYSNNPFLKHIPWEIEGRNDIFKIKSILEAFGETQNFNRLYESKLIFVGKGDVGKTSLMKVLKDRNTEFIDNEPTTHGINIDFLNFETYFPAMPPHYNSFKERNDLYKRHETLKPTGDNFDWEFERYIPLSEVLQDYGEEYFEEMTLHSNLWDFDYYYKKVDVRINLWDFGGQEIYHSTHQFFLTKRSVYLFVWEARKESTDEEFNYWLNIISILSNESPVIVVMNKSDIRIANIDEYSYKNKFPNITAFLKVSCKTKNGLDDLEDAINECLMNLDHLGKKLPSLWLEVRGEIQNIQKDYISYTDFIGIINSKQIAPQNETYLLSEYLHDVGEIIHFREDPYLRNIVIINPKWATKAVYLLIDTKEIQEKNGLFSIYDLEKYWDLNIYPIEKHMELIQLMEKFQICFKVIGSQNTYIIPELLQIDSIDNEIVLEIKKDNPLRFQIQYTFMPSGIITRLICRLYHLILKDNYWKNSVIFINESEKALVRENRAERTIDIIISGKQKYNLLSVIRTELKKINSDLNINEKYKEKIPCICNICLNSIDPYFFNYDFLKLALSKDIEVTHCEKSANGVNIHELVSGYSLTKATTKIIYHILSAASQLQGQSKIISEHEDARNQFISSRLMQSGFITKDQSRWGSSSTGLSQGELDIKVEDVKGNIISIFEGVNLSFVNTQILNIHLQKIILKYDPNGLFEKFMMVYYSGDTFYSFTKKYLDFIKNFEFNSYYFLDIIDESDNLFQYTELKVYKSIYKRSGKKVVLYHILVNIAK